MLALFCILGLAAAGFLTAAVYRKIDLVKLLVISGTVFVSIYVIISGILLLLDCFNLTLPAVLTFVAELVITAAIFFINDFEIPLVFPALDIYAPLIFILIACGIIANLNQAGYYGTGQDQGLYQIRAMYFIGGNYDNVLDFKEYYSLDNAYEKKHYKEEVEDLVGYYLLQEDGVADAKELEGVLHGISTFPALLALWGKIFGLVHMPGVLVFLYLLTIGNTWLVCENLKFKKVTATILCVLLGICPIVLWSTQNTLTEIGIALFVSSFLAFLTENQKKHLALMSTIPFMAACFFHVALSVIMPMVVVLYFMNFICTRDKKYLGAMGITAFGYAIGFTMMQKTAGHYVSTNLTMLFGKTGFLINETNILAVVWIVSAVIILLAVLFSLKAVSGKMLRRWKRVRKTEKGRKGMAVFMVSFAVLAMIVQVLQMISMVRQNMWLMKSGLMCYVMATGYIMVPLAFAAVFVLRRQIAPRRNYFTMLFSFLYVILMICGIVWPSVYFYYYFARYYVPFVSIVLVTAGFLIDRVTWKLTVPVGIACAAVVIIQSTLLYTERDLTYGDYQILENMNSCIGEDDCVLIYEQGYHIQRLFALQLKGLTGADIYYADPARIYAQMEDYGTLYANVFVLTYDLGGAFGEDSKDWRYVYRGMMHASNYEKLVKVSPPYAKEAVTVDSPVALMILKDELTD